MKRAIWLTAACLLGGLLTVALVGKLRIPARATTGRASAAGPGDVVINEVAWMGTEASSSDEWIELYNTTSSPIDIANWSIYGGDTGECLNFSDADGFVTTAISTRGYLLYANHEDDIKNDAETSIVDIWDSTIGMNNTSPGQIILYDAPACEGNVIDTVNQPTTAWLAGDSDNRKTMERKNPTTSGVDEANWATNDPAVARNGLDADGNPINGTPKAQNSCYHPPPEAVADLSVAKSGPASVKPGDTITYRILLGNSGAVTATGALLTDTLPAAVDFVTQTGEFTFTETGQRLTWDVGDVSTGTQHTITVTGCVSDTISSAFVNRVTATTTVSETVIANNVASFTTTVRPEGLVYLPLLLHDYTPPRYGVIIEAALYDGLQTNDYDEAVLLLNGGNRSVDLSGWELCKWRDTEWDCAVLPSVEIAPQQRLWLARSEVYFANSFGFAPHNELADWPRFSNDGDEVVLRDADGVMRDALVYESGLTDIDGWDGLALQPYGGSNFASEGQVLYRFLDEDTGLPADDTDTAADWAQDIDDPWRGRRVRYPGWDLNQFYRPALGVSGTVTVGIAPDNAHQLVVDAIRSAEESIEIEAYTLEHYDLVSELVQKANAGITVTVLLEGGPVGGVEDQELWACQQLHATDHGTCYFMVNADEFDIHDRYTYLHAKFMVIDRQRLLLGSQNLTSTSLPGDDKSNGTGGSRGVVLVTDAPAMVARAVEVFEADCDPVTHADVSMWGPDNVLGYDVPPPDFTPKHSADWVTYTVQFSQTTTVTGTEFELVTSPESALRTTDALLGLVGRAGAGDAIYVEQLYEHREWGDDPTDDPNPRLEAYIAAARRGARVRILLNGGDFDIEEFSLTKNINTAAYINEIAQAEGLDLSAHLGNPTEYGIHNKMVLVDLGTEGKYAHVGSINGSETSNKVNREMALQVRSAELFDYLYAVFDDDWNHQPPQGHLLVSEVMYNPDGQDTGREWIEIYNPTIQDVDLSGWYLGDVGPEGEYGSGLYRFPDGAVLVAEGVIVVAHQADDVTFTPDYEFLIDPNRDDGAVPNMSPAGSWDGFGLALGNTGDEVLLLDASGVAVDVVTYGEGNYPGVTPHPGMSGQGHSLERRPPRVDTDDCSQDFFDRYPPTPGTLPE